MEGPTVGKWVTAIGGGLFVFIFVVFISSFFLRNMAAPPLDIVVGLFLPLLIGLVAGVHTALRSLRVASKQRGSFRLDIGRRAYPTGHCQACGYDLRGTPDRCPECGTKG